MVVPSVHNTHIPMVNYVEVQAVARVLKRAIFVHALAQMTTNATFGMKSSGGYMQPGFLDNNTTNAG